MKARSILRLEATVVALLAASAGTAWAQEAFTVKGLRTDKVTLYDCNPDKEKRKPQEEVTKEKFSGPWPATRDPSSPLYLKVQVGKKEHCVRAFAVDTDKPVTIKKDQECGTMVAGRQLKTGATRGVGEECPKSGR